MKQKIRPKEWYRGQKTEIQHKIDNYFLKKSLKQMEKN